MDLYMTDQHTSHAEEGSCNHRSQESILNTQVTNPRVTDHWQKLCQKKYDRPLMTEMTERQGSISTPLHKHDQLSYGQLYYLFHLPKDSKETSGELDTEVGKKAVEEKAGQVRKQSSAGPEVEVLPSPGKGVWRVKMVIGREQGNTVALIERMRVAPSQGEPLSVVTQEGGQGRLAAQPLQRLQTVPGRLQELIFLAKPISFA